MQVAGDAPPAVLGLMADPLRWQLIGELARSDRRVGELVELVGRPQSVVSYHLGELRAGAVVDARRSSADGRDTYYRLDLERLRDLLASASGAVHPYLRLAAEPGVAPARRRRPASVLFLCTGNSARSQMAEALLNERAGGAVRAWSAGSRPKPLHPRAVAVMAERGIDIAGNRSKHLDRFTSRRFDRVITLCDKVREVCPEFPGPAPTAHWSIPDPAANDAPDAFADAFARVAAELDVRIDALLAEFAT